MGNGLPYNVRALYSHDGILYAGIQVINSNIDPLWAWNGAAWDTVETIGCPNNGTVFDIVEYQDNLITVGCDNLQEWDGSQWSLLGGGSNSAILGLSSFQNNLVAVGWFDTIGGIATSQVALWNGQQWAAIDTTEWTSSAISCAIEYQGDLYIGGNMLNLQLDIDRIGRWDGQQWQKVGNGIRGGIASVNCFAIYQGDLYVGGRFASGNGNPGPNIGRWDGEQWLGVGGGIDWPGGLGCDVRDMVVFEDELYAVGTCQLAGGISAERIAKWDGEEWCGFGDSFNNNISAIEVHQGELYIGGAFTTIDNDSISRVAKWVGGDFVDQCGSLSGIEEEAYYTELSIYPNPTSSTFTITWSAQDHGNYQMDLFDASGRKLAVPITAKAEGKLELDMSGLAPGIYFGRLVVDEGPFGSAQGKSFRVVKQ